MPGVKRKVPPSATSLAKATIKPASASPRHMKQLKYQDAEDSDNNDDFDDDEDLLASAVHGTGSAAIEDIEGEDDESVDDQDDDDEDEDDDDDDDDEESEESELELIDDEADEDDEDNAGSGFEDGEDQDHVELMSDEDMDGGFEDLEGSEGNDLGDDAPANSKPLPTSSASRPSKNSLYAIPTNAEVQGLKETGELFKNNVFKLKVDEMLPEIRPAYTKAGALELVLRRLQQLFERLSPIDPTPVGEAIAALQKKTKGKIRIPFPDPAPKADAQYRLGFEKPAGMHLVGSWPLRATTKRPEGIDVDVAIVMPSGLFQEKDHVNFRYFHKKAFYLAALAHAISESAKKNDIALGVTPSFSLVDGDPRRPILVLTPVPDRSETDFSKLKTSIRLHPSIGSEVFKPARLGPLRSNVRIGATGDNETGSVPSPRYNAAILADSLHLPHLVYLHTVAQACPAFADASLLLKTWAFQRGFGSGGRRYKKMLAGESHRRQVAGTGSIRFVLTMIMAHLLQGEEKTHNWKRDPTAARSKLSNGFSSYQLFRGVMDYLANHDFKAKPAFMKSMPSAGLVSRSDKIPREDFSRAFDKVLVDPSGMLNLFAFLPTGSVDLLQFEAGRTLEMLNDPSSDHFDALFLQARNAAPFIFDEVARLELSHSLKLRSGTNGKEEERNGRSTSSSVLLRADFGTTFQANMILISGTVSKALQGRAKLVALLHSASGGLLDTWPVDASRPVTLTEAEIGVVLDPEQAWRMVEHGPSSQDTQAAESFRQFWGKLSELRRFKDGRVLESVVWPVTTQASRWAIPRRILTYVLHRHHSIPESQLSFVSQKFDGLLSIDATLSRRMHLSDVEEKGFTLVQSAFDQLAKDLRSVESLPLSIISVSPSSSGLRGTSVFVPAPLDFKDPESKLPECASYVPVQDIIITFEGSGKWPNELSAIQVMKAAFLERMCAELPSKIGGGGADGPERGATKCRVVFDPSAASKMEDQVSLEIILPSGFAFRARVYHNRERVLLERILADRFETAAAKRRAKKILEDWERRFELAPLHHSYIASMGHRFPSFATAVRLVKRWVSAQMLAAPAIAEELLELACAAAYLSPEEGAPATGVAGFLRVLRLLANWRWKEEPLMVPIQSVIESTEPKETYSLATELRTEVEAKFHAARGSDPSMTHRAWFIATETDLHGLHWGRKGPVGGVADGVKKLAKAAVGILEEATLLTEADIQGLFTPSLSHYDFVIHLRPSVLARYVENVQADASVWGVKKGKFANLTSTDASLMDDKHLQIGSDPKPGFDAAERFLNLLRRLYSDSFRLFHDECGGTVIGGLFNPSLDQERNFKVGLGFSSQPNTEEKMKGQVKLNKAALVAEIERLGDGLVDRVVLQKS